MFSKKATKFDKIFTVDLAVTTYCQINAEDFINFCGLLRKYELYLHKVQIGNGVLNRLVPCLKCIYIVCN